MTYDYPFRKQHRDLLDKKIARIRRGKKSVRRYRSAGNKLFMAFTIFLTAIYSSAVIKVWIAQGLVIDFSIILGAGLLILMWRDALDDGSEARARGAREYADYVQRKIQFEEGSDEREEIEREYKKKVLRKFI